MKITQFLLAGLLCWMAQLSYGAVSPALRVFEPNLSPMKLDTEGLLRSNAGFTQVVKGSGIVLFGPYVPFSAGSYTAFFTVRSPDDVQRISAEVVYSGKESDDLFAISSLTLPRNDWQVVSLDFSLTVEDEKKELEFRLWMNSPTNLQVGSIFVVPKQVVIPSLQSIVAAEAAAVVHPEITESSTQSVAAWVAMQAEHLTDDDADTVLSAFRLLTAISQFDKNSSVYKYFHPLAIIGRLRTAAESLLQKKSNLPAEVREEILEHWVSLRVQILAGREIV